MKAINQNGKITIYQGVPQSFTSSQGVHLNAPNMSQKALEEAGLFDLIIDENYDERIHNLGEIYWDVASTVFRKDAEDKTWSETLQELKTNRINHFKSIVNSELQKTDWYVIRKADNNDSIPEDVVTARTDLRTQSATVENEINALTTKKEVILYDFPNI
jgi:hypothetical protein|tara:strand:- start:2887 stop:3366 length:480 start_codon:yes stop_codon:yes gene_type:complete